MNLAGVRFNRGDAYQVCVAMDWAIRMIKDREIAWMELDSTRMIGGSVSAPVDDVIVRSAGGNSTAC